MERGYIYIYIYIYIYFVSLLIASHRILPEVYLKPSRRSIMFFFAKLVLTDERHSLFSQKNSTIDVQLGSKCASHYLSAIVTRGVYISLIGFLNSQLQFRQMRERGGGVFPIMHLRRVYFHEAITKGKSTYTSMAGLRFIYFHFILS